MLKEDRIMRKIVKLQTTSTIGKDGKTDIMKEAKKAFYIAALLYALGKSNDLDL